MTTQSNSEPIPDVPTTQSRRDFLRRAGREAAKEAVEIGVKVVPGAALAKRFIAGAEPSPDTAGDDVKPNPVNNPLGWLAAWRKDKAKP